VRKKSIFITGGAGMFATDLATYFLDSGDYDVIVKSHNELDIVNHEAVKECLYELRPDIIINTPGSEVEKNELDPVQAFAVNTWAPKQMAQIANQINAIFVYISTCGLFGDEIQLYNEYEQVSLKTVYAKSKYAGEQAVRNYCPRSFIIRLGWLYGGTVAHKRNFVAARYHEADGKNIFHSAADKFGSPTYTMDAVETIFLLLQTNAYDIFHVANQGCVSRLEYVTEIMKLTGRQVKVKPVDSSNFPRHANVPDCEALTSINLQLAGIRPMADWQDALRNYCDRLLKELN
jgi:dTDP-4-dehydrorhamnose reductase